MKIQKQTIIKLVAALIVPGGFIVWGLHELSRYYRQEDKNVSPDVAQTGSGDEDSSFDGDNNDRPNQ